MSTFRLARLTQRGTATSIEGVAFIGSVEAGQVEKDRVASWHFGYSFRAASRTCGAGEV
jgi:hypothetical protein